jgi:2-oxo-3-hexenedioate decarboxylase
MAEHDGKVPEPTRLTAASVCDLFLDHSEKHNSPRTFEWCKGYLRRKCLKSNQGSTCEHLNTRGAPTINRHVANEQLIEELLQARDDVQHTTNPSNIGLDLSLGRAYQIGRGLHERLVARGFRPVGRKIGFTNRAMWEQFKVSEPIWAHMYEQTVHCAQEGHLRFSLAGMVAPRLEPEIVFRLRTALPGGEPSFDALIPCIEWVAVGFEIVDSHYADWRFTAAEAVADFGVHAALVVGTPWRLDSDNRHELASVLKSLQVTLQGGAGFNAQGEGRNALGNPLLALAHLVRVLSAQPWAPPLAAGEVITTGTLTALPYIRSGESYCVKVEGAPLAQLQLELHK